MKAVGRSEVSFQQACGNPYRCIGSTPLLRVRLRQSESVLCQIEQGENHGESSIKRGVILKSELLAEFRHGDQTTGCLRIADETYEYQHSNRGKHLDDGGSGGPGNQ